MKRLLLANFVLFGAITASGQSTILAAEADTYLRNGSPNSNQGTLSVLSIQGGNDRILVRMNQAAIAAVASPATLQSAKLRLYIAKIGNNWTPAGRPLNVHRMTQAWTESGATWNCPNDTNPSNNAKDCSPDWNMTQAAQAPFLATPTAVVVHTNSTSGWVEWNVTADVAAFLAGTANHGWVVKKSDEAQDGSVDYSSREGAFKPELVLTVSGPQITDFNPKAAPPGSAVTVTGSGLAPGAGASLRVVLNALGGGTIDAPVSTSATNSLTFVVPAGAATGPVKVTVNSQTATSTVPLTITTLSDFTLSATPASVDLLRGQTAGVVIRMLSGSGFSQSADLSVSGLPAGITGSFKPQRISVGEVGVLTLSAPIPQALGSASLTVAAASTAQGLPVNRTANFTVNVRPVSMTFLGRTVVDDALQTPLAGVTVKMLGTNGSGGTTSCVGSAVSDAGGNFSIQNLPATCVGQQLIGFDGLTATAPAGKYAGVNLVYTFNSGQITVSPVLVHLPRIDNQETFYVTQNSASDQSHSFASVPGLSVTVYRNTLFTMPDGSQPNPFPLVGVQVPVDRLPDAKPPVPTMVSAFIVAFQPANARASQPVAVLYPNSLTTAPNSNMTLMTLDPTRGRMVPYGTGTVSPDGSQIVPDLDPAFPGKRYGIVNFDWHGPMPPPTPAVNPPASSGGTGRGTGGTCGCGGSAAQAGDPVDLSTGLYVSNVTDMTLGGPRGTIAIERIYRTLSNIPGPFGLGSEHLYDYRLDTGQPSAAQAINLINPDGSRSLFSRQPDGTLINTTAPHLRGAVMAAPASNQATLFFKDGSVMKFTPAPNFAALSWESSITDPNGNVIAITRNPSRPQQMTAIADPVGRQLSFSYDGGDRITSITDPIGRVVSYTYDGVGNLRTVMDPEGGVTTYTYDAQNLLTQMVNPRGVTMFRNVFDGNGRVVQQVQPDGGIMSFAYTLSNPLVPTSPVLSTAVTDPLGRTTTYRFNPQGFVVQVTDALGQSKVMDREAGTNLLLAATGNGVCPVCGSPESGDVRYTYDSNGNILTQTDVLGRVTAFTYEPKFNQVTSVRDPLGNMTRLTYDTAGNLTGVTDANGKSTTFTYDSVGQLKDVRDPLNQRTTLAYDAFGNLISSTDALGKVTTFLWDGISRSTAVRDALSRISRVTYDRLNRVVTQTDPAGGVTRFVYDAVSNMLSLTDARNNRTAFAYDNKNRVTTRTTQQGRVDTRVYDLNDNLTRFTDRRGQLSTFVYDALDRLTQETYQDATVTRVYDANSRLGLVNDTVGGNFLYTYDGAGRLALSVGPTGSVLYARDALGRVAQRTVVGLAPVTYSYDPVGNLLSASMPQASVTQTYDARNQLATMTRSNGVNSTYTRDPLGRIMSLVHARGATALNTQTYAYDDVGRRMRQTTNIAQPLITQPVVSTVDSENRLLTRGGVTYTYDANGNRLTETRPGGTTTYGWDSRGRLASLTSAGQTTTFRYDFAGMMLNQTGTGTTATFVVDDLTNVIAQGVANGQLDSVLSGRSLDAHYAVAQGGQISFGLPDSINSTVSTADLTGNLNGQQLYEPYGQSTTSGSSYPFKYTGRTQIGENLHYYRSRVLDPIAGRFISEDPIGFAGQDSNLTRYVQNNPATLTDPTGKIPVLAWVVSRGLICLASEPCRNVVQAIAEYGVETFFEGKLPYGYASNPWEFAQINAPSLIEDAWGYLTERLATIREAGRQQARSSATCSIGYRNWLSSGPRSARERLEYNYGVVSWP